MLTPLRPSYGFKGDGFDVCVLALLALCPCLDFKSLGLGVNARGEDFTKAAPLYLLRTLVLVPLTAARFFLLSSAGCWPERKAFVRADFLFPSEKKLVGPSALAFLHGGDAARDVEREVSESVSRRRFAGGASF